MFVNVFVYYPLFWCSSITESSLGYNGDQSCVGCLSDSCDKEDGVCTYISGCKSRRQLGPLKKCGRDIKAMFNLFLIQDEVTCQFLKIILEPINKRKYMYIKTDKH